MRTVTRASRSSAARAQRRSCVRDGSPRPFTPYCTANVSLASGVTSRGPGISMRVSVGGSGNATGSSRLVALVGVDDTLHQGMAHHVLRIEIGERDAPDLVQHRLCLDQTALLAAREVDLGDIAVDDGLAAETDAREEHLHLLGRGVLRLIEYHERMVERAPAHERQWSDLDGAAIEEL